MPKVLQRFACEICEHEYRTEEEAKQCEAQGIRGDQYSVGEEYYKLGEMDSFDPSQIWRITEKFVNRKRHEAKYRMVDAEGHERIHDRYDLERGFTRTNNPNFEPRWREFGWCKLSYERYVRAYVDQLVDHSSKVGEEVTDLSRALVLEECARPWFKDSDVKRLILDLPEKGSVWFRIKTIPGDKEAAAPYRKLAEVVVGKQNDQDQTQTPITQLDLGSRIESVLRRHGVTRVQNLITCTELDLLRMRMLGKKGVDRIKEVLKARKLSLKSE